jgi:hypothetical protein
MASSVSNKNGKTPRKTDFIRVFRVRNHPHALEKSLKKELGEI